MESISVQHTDIKTEKDQKIAEAIINDPWIKEAVKMKAKVLQTAPIVFLVSEGKAERVESPFVKSKLDHIDKEIEFRIQQINGLYN
jgi:hypothetical protein